MVIIQIIRETWPRLYLCRPIVSNKKYERFVHIFVFVNFYDMLLVICYFRYLFLCLCCAVSNLLFFVIYSYVYAVIFFLTIFFFGAASSFTS